MAGYGPKFFTSHSFRAGYANRKAAEVLASGGTWQDVLDHLSDGILILFVSHACQTFPEIATTSDKIFCLDFL
jgi:hypothetical protein